MALAFLGDLPSNARVTVDSAPIIYFLEDHPRLAARFAPVFDAAAQGALSIFVSAITVAEVVAGPLKAGNEVSSDPVPRSATRLQELGGRSGNRGNRRSRSADTRSHRLRLPDAIQVAAGFATGSVALVTHDVDFYSVREIRIVS